jgi:divalent metal cation (Fe/Co/Zn/Cd) transporter
MAYYVGARLQVEVDIVLPAKLPLNKAHDIGEALTLRLEALDDVERAFVHLDTEWDHMRAIEHVDPYSKDL